MKKILVIHHRADYDGIFCREIARKFLGESAEYLGWDYGDPIPVIDPSVEKIYMLDISIDGLMSDPRLIWIDHHKSAIEKWTPDVMPSPIAGYRIDGVAACRLVWQWFIRHSDGQNDDILPPKQFYVERRLTEPLAVRLAGEYDVWSHELSGFDDVRFQFGLDSQFALGWDLLLSNSRYADEEVKRIISDGQASQQCYAKRDADVMRERSFIIEWEGLKFLALTIARCNSNTFAARDIPATGHDALMAFYYTGKAWSFSLYHAAHRKDIDLSKIAVKYGGGGHRGACGFRLDSLSAIGIK